MPNTKHIEVPLNNGDVLSDNPLARLQTLSPTIRLNLRKNKTDKNYTVLNDTRSQRIRKVNYKGVECEVLATVFVYMKPINSVTTKSTSSTW